MSTAADTSGGRPKRAAALKRNYKEVEEDDEFEVAEETQPKKRQKRQPAQPKAEAVPALKPKGALAETKEFAPSGSSVTAKPRSRRGGGRKKKTLSLLPTMPFDIQVEILKYLSPLDLVRVSMVCKPLHMTLENPDVQHIWRNAIDGQGAPQPPEGWTPQRWSELLFEHACQTPRCHISKGVQLVDYHTCRRLCYACRVKLYLPEQIVMQRHDILQGLDPHLVMELTPSTPIAPTTQSWGGWRRRRAENSHQKWWARDDLVKVANVIKGKVGSELEVYKAEQRLRLKERHELALRCSRWKSSQEANALLEKDHLRYERRKEVSNRLKAMDCSDDETWYAMKAKVVERPGILTERSWHLMLPKLQERIEALRQNPAMDSDSETFEYAQDYVYDDY